MMIGPKYLQLDQMAHPIALSVDGRFIEALDLVFANWAFKFTDECETTPFATIVYKDGSYEMTSEFMDKPAVWNDPLNSICEMIVEIAWARLRQQPELLCLHGAAIEFGNRLVVFPATRRAGKSTLTVALAAAGQRVFTDDFLPIALSPKQEMIGISNGISPRLRLPVPETFGARANQYIESRSFIANTKYQYVTPRAHEQARFGDKAPLGALVYLEREDGATAELSEISKADALKNLITQNFARAINANGILKLMDFACSELPIYRLTYHNIDEAIALLQTQFSKWETEVPRVSETLRDEMFGIIYNVETTVETVDIAQGNFVHQDEVFVVEAEGKRFLTGHNGKTIHLLNDLAAAIWNVLSEPTTLDEAIEIVSIAFPNESADKIATDVEAVFSSFGKNGLLKDISNCDSNTKLRRLASGEMV